MPDFNTLNTLNLVAEVATAVGVAVAGWQLVLAKRLAAQQFEDHIAGQYRELIRRLPPEAILGETLTDAEVREALPAFIHYFDLSNEQAFLHSRRRISGVTWANWRDGIQEHLRRPGFTRAWAEVAARAPDSFTHLRRLCPPQTFDGRDPNRGSALRPGLEPRHPDGQPVTALAVDRRSHLDGAGVVARGQPKME